MTEGTSSSGGIGVTGLLGVAFVVLKLTGYITWSWWIVTAPFWAPLAIVATVLICIAAFAFAAATLAYLFD
jgi:hypothetical protein